MYEIYALIEVMLQIMPNVALKEFTTFKVGGPARYFVAVKNTAELVEAVQFAKKNNLPFFILGGGSNILISDTGFSGVIIKNEIRGKKITAISDTQSELVAGSGEDWDEIVNFAVQNNLYGLENLSGIPGTVGASPVQNIGAYGREVSRVISRVEVLDTDTLTLNTLNNQACGFSYRYSIFKNKKKYIITAVSFSLQLNGELDLAYQDVTNYFKDQKIAKPTLVQVRQAILAIRSAKMPSLADFGLAGSFFKNPIITKEKYQQLLTQFPDLPHFPVDDLKVKIPLAWILDKVCQLKGYRENNVGLYQNQPLVLVNYGGATANEIKNFSEKIKKIVKQKTEIKIETEVELL